MRVYNFAFSVSCLVGLAAATARGQEPDTLSPAYRAGIALAQLRVGQRVRIRASGMGRVQGWLVSHSATLVSLRISKDSVAEVPAPSLDSVWVKHGSHAGRGALIGLVVGGLALGIVADAGTSPSSCSELCISKGGAFALGALVGGLGGAGIGALIGANFPRWRLEAP